MTAKQAKARGPTEAEFTRQVIKLAKLCGWRVAHFRPGRTAKGGWITAMSGDVGYPDLTLCHERRGIGLAVELKVGRNKTSPEQDAWLDAFGACGFLVATWRPEAWDVIERTLKGELKV